MNRDNALRSFVNKYRNHLLSADWDNPDFKRIRREFFFVEHKNEHGQPKHAEIAPYLLRILVDGGMAPSDIEDKIANLPFFKWCPADARDSLLRDIAAGSLKADIPEEVLKESDQRRRLSILQEKAKREVLQGKDEELKLREAESQARLDHLQREFDEKRQALDDIASLLDAGQDEEKQEFDPQVEISTPWWRRFYLRDDPFPADDGLASIEESLYDEVVFRSELIQRLLQEAATDRPSFFGKGTLLSGAFGSGKTTLIDFLSYHFATRHRILPIRIACRKSQPGVDGHASYFFRQLRLKLSDESKKIGISIPDGADDMDLDERVIEMIRLLTAGRWKAVLIFMDDYHKHHYHFPVIFDFLGSLQPFANDLTRAGRNVGFIVSGIPEWDIELKQNGQLKGFLSGVPLRMPEVTPEIVCEVFNKRLKAFCYDKTPRTIRRDFVDILIGRRGSQGSLRSYMSDIIEELANNNLSIVDTPVDIALDIIEAVRSHFMRNQFVGTSLNELIYKSSFERYTKEQVSKCLELLVQCFLQRRVSERDRLFLENQTYFRRLRDCRLIQKVKYDDEKRAGWQLAAHLQTVIETVQQEYGINFPDYFLKAFSHRGMTGIEPVDLPVSLHWLSEARKFFAEREDSLEKVVFDNVMNGLKLIESTILKGEGGEGSTLLSRAYDAFGCLSRATFQLDDASSFFGRAGIVDLGIQWQLHPRNTETITEALNRYEETRRNRNKLTIGLGRESLQTACQDVVKIAIAQSRRFRREGSPGILSRPLSHVESTIPIFDDAESAYYSARTEDHIDYVNRLTEHVHQRLREFLFLVTTIVREGDHLGVLPGDTKSYAYRNISSKGAHSALANPFEGLTRTHWRQLFTQGGVCKNEIFDKIGIDWTTEDRDSFFELFAGFSIATDHQVNSSFHPSNRDKYLKYCLLAEKLLSSINLVAARFIQERSYICLSKENGRVSDCLFGWTLRPGIRDSKVFGGHPKDVSLFDCIISEEEESQLSNILHQKIRDCEPLGLVHDLFDLESLYHLYGMQPLKVMCFLAFQEGIAKNVKVVPWFGSQVLIRNR